MSTPTLRSVLAPAILDYLALKQSLGRRCRDASYVLTRFDAFLGTLGAEVKALTPEIFAAWAVTLAHLSPTTRHSWMRIVRNFCLYIRRADPACYVPDPSLFPAPGPRAHPYIFSEGDIVRLMSAASALKPGSTSPLCREGCRLAVVLLYTAGLRRGELVRLAIADYDPRERTLLIRESKFHKSRIVALSKDATAEMESYLAARRRLPHDDHAPLLVWSLRGLRGRSGPGLGNTLRKLFRRAGIRTASGRVPRVHDLRHTHAAHVLLRWYRSGVDVQAKLPALAASMGHVSVVSTAYYLTLLDPIAEAAADLFAEHCRRFLPPPEGESR